MTYRINATRIEYIRGQAVATQLPLFEVTAFSQEEAGRKVMAILGLGDGTFALPGTPNVVFHAVEV